MVREHVVRITPLITPAGECPECGFDSLRRVRMFMLSSTGVSPVADVTACGRCRNKDRP